MSEGLRTGTEASAQIDLGGYAGKRAVAAAAVGNALEWYDFTVYALFAIYVGRSFFPGGDHSVELVKAFLSFGLGFIIRPLGAILLGEYGDRAGRKAALTLTIMTMAIGTLVIGVAPTYAAIGIGAPILLLCGRVLQGFSAGGEIGGAAAFLVEHAPPHKKGVYASWLQASMAFSNILGALVATIVTALLTVQQLGQWGWRIPFLLGGLCIAPIGMWLRRSLSETPLFQEEMERKARDKRANRAPLLQVFRDFPTTLLVGIATSVLWGVCVYTLIIYMPTYFITVLKFSGKQAFLAALIGNIFMTIACVVFGAISDRIGRVRMLATPAVLMILFVYPLLKWLQTSHTTASLVLVQTVFCIVVAMFVGVAPATVSEIFPTRVRSTGMSLSYNIAVTVFGGFAPAILAWFTRSANNTFAPVGYVGGAAVITLIALCFVPAAARRAAAAEIQSAQAARV